MHLTSHITHSNGYAPYIAYYRSNGYEQRFRKLKPKPKLNQPNAHRSQIKMCENRQTQNVQFRFMLNAFRILKPIQKSSKRVWVFRNTGANAFAKNQMRLAYEDKRDLYCTYLRSESEMVVSTYKRTSWIFICSQVLTCLSVKNEFPPIWKLYILLFTYRSLIIVVLSRTSVATRQTYDRTPPV